MNHETTLHVRADAGEGEPSSWALEDIEKITQLLQLELTPGEFQEREMFHAKLLADHELLTHILFALSVRKIEGELPIDPTIARETLVQFLEQRNLQECQKLQRSCQAFLARIRAGGKHVNKDVQQWVEDACTLLALERRKAIHIEQAVCPLIFRGALEQAKGDVYQFLIGERARGGLRKKIPSMEGIRVDFRDDLNYLLEGHSPVSMGDMSRAGVMILRIPASFTSHEEARIYHAAVHEYVHGVSLHTPRRLGLHIDNNEGLEMMNEAVTELTAAAIVCEHILRGKKRLKGQQMPEISTLPYRKEIVATINSVMRHVSLENLQDAMLNPSGLRRLVKKLDAKFAGKGRETLKEFARNIKELYEPISRRQVPTEWQRVFPIEHYRRDLRGIMGGKEEQW